MNDYKRIGVLFEDREEGLKALKEVKAFIDKWGSAKDKKDIRELIKEVKKSWGKNKNL